MPRRDGSTGISHMNPLSPSRQAAGQAAESRACSLLHSLLHLFPAVPRSFGDRLADPFGRFFDAFPDLAFVNLLRAPFDLMRRGLHLRIIGSEGESGCKQREREDA